MYLDHYELDKLWILQMVICLVMSLLISINLINTCSNLWPGTQLHYVPATLCPKYPTTFLALIRFWL